MPFLASSRHLGRVWLAAARASAVREMEFRANFIMGIVREVLWLLAFVFLTEIIFYNTSSLSGWNREGVLAVLALSRIVEGLMNTLFVDNIMALSEKVQRGTFDFVLIRPLPVQFAAFFQRISFLSAGNVLIGLVLLGYVHSSDPTLFTLGGTALAAVLGFFGIVTYYSLLLLAASLVFVIERMAALWGFSHLFSEPLTVPFDVFPRGPRLALTYVLPLAFVVFVPAQALTGRLVWWQVPLAIVITIVLLVLANVAWRAGLRRYTSASS